MPKPYEIVMESWLKETEARITESRQSVRSAAIVLKSNRIQIVYLKKLLRAARRDLLAYRRECSRKRRSR